MDLLGCIIVGLVTSTGGGTIRDVLLDLPPFWIPYHIHLHVSIWTSTLTFLIWPAIVARGFKATHLAFLWSDALGMAASTVIGSHVGLQATACLSSESQRILSAARCPLIFSCVAYFSRASRR